MVCDCGSIATEQSQSHSAMRRNMKRNLVVGVMFFSVLGVASFAQKKAVAPPTVVQAPMFEVDPLWPKPLPNHWILGAVIGVSIDKDDNLWILHRPNTPEPMETYA